MEIVRFEDVKESIINNMRRSMLIPIIGSGLTRKCRSLKGVVPSGDDYRKYMLEEISQAITLSPDENERLNTAPFSTVSEVYYESGIIPLDRQRCYLRVILPMFKLKIISRSFFHYRGLTFIL